MSDTQSAPCGVGGFGFVPIAIDHPKIPDELRGDVARLLDKLGIANAYIDALEARVAELEWRCKRLEEAVESLLPYAEATDDESSEWGPGRWKSKKLKRIIDEARKAKEAKP